MNHAKAAGLASDGSFARRDSLMKMGKALCTFTRAYTTAHLLGLILTRRQY
jgi:hypothetical protein